MNARHASRGFLPRVRTQARGEDIERIEDEEREDGKRGYEFTMALCDSFFPFSYGYPSSSPSLSLSSQTQLLLISPPPRISLSLSLSDDFRRKVIRVRNEIVNCCEATLKLREYILGWQLNNCGFHS